MSREVLKQSISFHLNSKSGVPPYLQLVRQVEQALRVGIISVGDQLPTVKQVVAQVALNPNTVMKAYRELENAAIVKGHQGVGTFVVLRPESPPPSTHVRLARSLSHWIDGARKLGLSDAAIEDLLHSTLRHDQEKVA
jgi:GntR family transcriptional regulator